MFGPAAGLVLYVSAVPERRGADLHRLSWSQEPPAAPLDDPTIEDWVAAEVTPFLDGVGGTPLVVAKSLGTFAAGLAADRSLPAVWLTPVLTVPDVPAALARATAPFLLVGGTADEVWDGALARELTPHVIEVARADHGMMVPGPVSASITVLGRVVESVDRFLEEIGWP